MQQEDEETGFLRKTRFLAGELYKVFDARCRLNGFSEDDKLLHGRLDKMLAESGCAEVYTFVELLNVLGFKVAIALK